MERIMRTQAMGDPRSMEYMKVTTRPRLSQHTVNSLFHGSTFKCAFFLSL